MMSQWRYKANVWKFAASIEMEFEAVGLNLFSNHIF